MHDRAALEKMVVGPRHNLGQAHPLRCSRCHRVQGAQRSKFAPNVPTLLEQGLKDMVFNEWFGFFLPAKATPEVIQRANTALRAALAEREVVEGLEVMGLEAKSSSPAELGAMLKADTARWGPVVKAVGFTAES